MRRVNKRYLFRAKRPCGDWVYGGLDYNSYGELCITSEDGQCYIIDEKTIGQCIGKSDVTGLPIYDGDIVNPEGIPLWFEYDNDDACYILTNNDWSKPVCKIASKYEVIGNIYDNKELFL